MNMRAAEDLQFAEMIRSVARGIPLWKTPSLLPGGLPECEDGFIWIPPFFRMVYSVDAAVDSLFPDPDDAATCSSRLFLTSTNEVVDEVNGIVLRRLITKLRQLAAHESLSGALETETAEDDEERQNVVCFGAVRKPKVPDQFLHLKVGAVVSVLRNVAVSDGIANGTVLRVADIDDHLLTCETLDT